MNKNFYKLKSFTLHCSPSLYEFSRYRSNVLIPYKSWDFIAGIKTYVKLQHISDDLSLKRAILNFAKCVARNKLPNILLDDYSLLLGFLKDFDPSIYITGQNFAYYKRVEAKLEVFLLNSRVLSFTAFVKNKYPHFSEE